MPNTDKPDIVVLLSNLMEAIKAVEAAEADYGPVFVKNVFVFKSVVYGEKTRIAKINAARGRN